MSNSERPYDVVVWGATGFVGQLVVEYLTDHYEPDGLALAIGGRNNERLERVARARCRNSDAWDDLPILLGDATDPASLRAIARKTQVVCTTVGPYTSYGTPLVKACIESETDYCDLTGEVTWIREMIDRYHEDALEAGVRIVHSCGFDSVPADLGTLLVQSHATETYGTSCNEVDIYFEDGSGGVSGGTVESMVTMFEEATQDPTAREVLRDPYSLAPPDARDGSDAGEQRLPKRDQARGGWTAPSPMAAVNERVIRRSHGLLGTPWGDAFQVREVIPTGDGPAGMATATMIAGGLGLTAASLSVAPIRSLLNRFVFPNAGEGPSRAAIENGYFTIVVSGRGTGPDGPFTVECTFGADRDPGYGATATMIGEAAICLCHEEIDSPVAGGILTPASGIGEPLADRLRAAGFRIDVTTRTGRVDRQGHPQPSE